jgi:putative phage-type endonuclease
MSYTIVRPADHDAWIEERKKGIGSSDAGTIMCVSPFSTPLKLWRQRLGIDPPVKESAAMRNGHFLEPAVAEYFADATGSTIDYSSEGDWLAVDNERPWLRVSPDRLFWPEGVEHNALNWCILEIKSTSKLVDKDNLPLYWVCQVQYQMGILGIHTAAIAWITSMPRLEMNYAWVTFNPAFFKTLTDQIDHFWKVNLQQKVMPEPIDQDDVKLRWPTSEDSKLVTATEEDVKNCERYVELTDEMEQLKEKLNLVTTAIKKRIADGEALIAVDEETGRTTTIARFKSINETVFDEEKFRDENPEVYVKYLQQSFDTATFKDEDKILFNKYSSKKKGARRFSVSLPS